MRLLFNAGALHGARPGHWTGRDIAFFSGCRVATVLYCTFSRPISVAAERRIADAETTELERAAEQPARRQASSPAMQRQPGALALTGGGRYQCWSGQMFYQILQPPAARPQECSCTWDRLPVPGTGA